MTDQELQEMLDNQRFSEKTDLTNPYQKLFDNLDGESGFELSPGFAHRVTSSLAPRKTSDRPLIWIITLSSLGMCLVAFILLLIFGTTPNLNLSGPGLQITYMFAILVIISIVFTRIEKRIIKKS